METLSFSTGYMHKILDWHNASWISCMPTSYLTERENDVLRWVAEGKSSWEVGQILSISERTVKFHLSNIYRKFGVTSRAQAIVYAMRSNLLESSVN